MLEYNYNKAFNNRITLLYISADLRYYCQLAMGNKSFRFSERLFCLYTLFQPKYVCSNNIKLVSVKWHLWKQTYGNIVVPFELYD